MTSIRLHRSDVRAAAPAAGRSVAGSRNWVQLLVSVVARSVLYTVIGMAFWAVAPAAIGWHATTVMSDSMAPLIRAGDVVVATSAGADHLSIGQILLVHDPDHADRLRLHRFVGVSADGRLITKGDANERADSTRVDPSAVVGVGVLRIPFLGAPVVWARDAAWPLLAAATAALAVLLAASGQDRRLRSALLAPLHRGEVARRRTRTRPRILRTARRLRSVMFIAGAPALGFLLAAALVLSGGAGAVFSRTAANGADGFASTTFSCLDRSPANAPYFFYAFNEASGSTAVDSSGNSRSATLTAGATRTAGSCATNASPVLTLDGSTGQVTTATAVSAPKIFTIATWFRTNSTVGAKLIGFGNSQSGTSTQYDRHLYLTSAGRLIFGVYNTSAITVTSPASYNNNAWHLATATLSTAGMMLYVDGLRVVSSTAATTAESDTGYWRIGYDNLSGWPSTPTDAHFAGDLDNVAVYTTALTATQISALYAAGR
ncbi:hypothetical protein BH11ACT2_BH11ACT2_06210 [soil metagenome]